MVMEENNDFNILVEAFKKLNIKDKKKVLLHDVKELMIVLQGINDDANSFLYNREILDLEKNDVTEEDYIEGLFVYINSIKELIARYVLKD